MKCPSSFEKYQKYQWEARKGVIATGVIIDITENFLHVLRTLDGKKEIVTFLPDSMRDKLEKGIVIWLQKGADDELCEEKMNEENE